MQIENKINHLGKNKIDIHSQKETQKEFIKRNTLILNNNKGLKVKSIMFLQQKLIRLL